MNVCTLAPHLRLRGTVVSHISHSPSRFIRNPSFTVPSHAIHDCIFLSMTPPLSFGSMSVPFSVQIAIRHSLSHRACQQGPTLFAPARKAWHSQYLPQHIANASFLSRSVPSPYHIAISLLFSATIAWVSSTDCNRSPPTEQEFPATNNYTPTCRSDREQSRVEPLSVTIPFCHFPIFSISQLSLYCQFSVYQAFYTLSKSCHIAKQ